MFLLARASMANRALIVLITLFVALFGVLSMRSMKQELIPSLGHTLNDDPALLDEVRTVTDAALKLA